MPHLIIEHSADISEKSITELSKEIQTIMNSHEGNFDADQCKCRSFAFKNYLVGHVDQKKSSFVHITLKALSGRSVEVRKTLAVKIMHFSHKFILDLDISSKRCDISVDIVEMERETYQKVRVEN